MSFPSSSCVKGRIDYFQFCNCMWLRTRSGEDDQGSSNSEEEKRLGKGRRRFGGGQKINYIKRFEFVKWPAEGIQLASHALRAVLRDQGLWAKEACEPCPPGRSFGAKARGPKRLASHALRGGPAGPRPAGQNSQPCPLGSKPVGRRGLRAMKACGPKSNCEPCPSGRSFGTAA